MDSQFDTDGAPRDLAAAHGVAELVTLLEEYQN
jgi:hypothetical protein